jgi:hypothetical protein
MSNEKFDPIAVEAQLVQARILPARADTPPAYLGTVEEHFTEHDPRKWALWRISMVRSAILAVTSLLIGALLPSLATWIQAAAK